MAYVLDVDRVEFGRAGDARLRAAQRAAAASLGAQVARRARRDVRRARARGAGSPHERAARRRRGGIATGAGASRDRPRGVGPPAPAPAAAPDPSARAPRATLGDAEEIRARLASLGAPIDRVGFHPRWRLECCRADLFWYPWNVALPAPRRGVVVATIQDVAPLVLPDPRRRKLLKNLRWRRRYRLTAKRADAAHRHLEVHARRDASRARRSDVADPGDAARGGRSRDPVGRARRGGAGAARRADAVPARRRRGGSSQEPRPARARDAARRRRRTRTPRWCSPARDATRSPIRRGNARSAS